jgi:hypothetical protein
MLTSYASEFAPEGPAAIPCLLDIIALCRLADKSPFLTSVQFSSTDACVIFYAIITGCERMNINILNSYVSTKWMII